MEEHTVIQKIYGANLHTMFSVVRNKITFLDKVNGLSITKILDGVRGKYILPDDDYGFISEDKKGYYYEFELEDDSLIRIVPDEAENSLKFYFKTNKDKLDGIRETVLNYIDYDYEKETN